MKSSVCLVSGKIKKTLITASFLSGDKNCMYVDVLLSILTKRQDIITIDSTW